MITPFDEQTTDAPAVRGPSGKHPPLAATPAPSPIAGLEPLTRRTFRRLARLSLRNASASPSIMTAIGVTACSLAIGSAFIAGQNGAADPIAVAAIATPIGLVAFVFIAWFFLAGEIRGWARDEGWVVGYFTADSSQLVHPASGDWVLTDHYTAHRGGGEAGPFRRQVFAHLAAEADLHQVVIRFDTKVRRLIDIYLQDMPGLELIDTRRGRLTTVYFLERTPRPFPSP